MLTAEASTWFCGAVDGVDGGCGNLRRVSTPIHGLGIGSGGGRGPVLRR